jgi:hypothetical protein
LISSTSLKKSTGAFVLRLPGFIQTFLSQLDPSDKIVASVRNAGRRWPLPGAGRRP